MLLLLAVAVLAVIVSLAVVAALVNIDVIAAVVALVAVINVAVAAVLALFAQTDSVHNLTIYTHNLFSRKKRDSTQNLFLKNRFFA